MVIVTTPRKIIAVVGLSNRDNRPSYQVAQSLQKYGYRIIAVNPQYAGQTILGEYCYASLTEAANALKTAYLRIDIVDCFRRSSDIPPLADEAISVGATCLWMQIGIVNEEAAAKARAAGLVVIMDLCTKVEVEAGRLHGVL
jgi:predicted CoA-binding protein